MYVRLLGQSGVQGADDVAVGAVSIGAGVAALCTIAVASAKNTVAASANAVQLLAANANRVGASIANLGSTPLHVTAGSTEFIVPPGAKGSVPENWVGVVNGWWEGTPSGNAATNEITV